MDYKVKLQTNNIELANNNIDLQEILNTINNLPVAGGSTADLNEEIRGCTNPNLVIYVADEVTKTKIESSTNFPSTATVVIGQAL